jgi:GcrA cell cycle regulator
MKGIWTKERVDLLKRLWSEGKTATAISASLDGISRSAVLGKIFRLRLAPGADTAAQVRDDQAQGNRVLFGQRRPGRPPAPGRMRGKSLLELDNESCRWPYGRPGMRGFHFCGATGADLENGRPYCADHMRRAYLPRERKPKKPQGGGAPHRVFTPRSFTLVSARTGQWQRLSGNFRRSRI